MRKPFVIGKPRRLKPEIEERIVALLKQGLSCAEVVEALAIKSVGIGRVISARDRAGLGPGAAARAALAAKVRRFTPEECRAYQAELAARDAAKEALAGPPRPPAPPVRPRRNEELRPELERREEAIDEMAPPRPAPRAPAEPEEPDEEDPAALIDAAIREADEAAGCPAADEGLGELVTGSPSAFDDEDEAQDHEAPEAAPEEMMETAQSQNPAEELNHVLADIEKLDELRAEMSRKREQLAGLAMELAATIEGIAQKAREVATGAPAPTPAMTAPPAPATKLTGRLARVHQLVAKAGEMRMKQIEAALGSNPSNLLRELVAAGHLVKADRGVYRAA